MNLLSKNRVAFALLCAFATSFDLPAQTTAGSHANPAAGAGHTIAGVVVNARSGQPVLDAEVVLVRTPVHNEERQLTASTVTDGEGRFVFANLPAGKFALNVSHRGYIASSYEQHENGSTAIVTGESADTAALDIRALTFRLEPQGVLYGTVTEDSGDPVPGAQIAVYRQDLSRGIGNTVRSNMVSADDQGNYEIAGLAPGSYFLSVTGTPWYATQEQVEVNAKPSGQLRSPLDVAYPTTFYPDATDAAFAAPIAIAGGDRVPVNLTMHPVPSLHVTLHLPGGGADRQFSVPQLRQDVFGATNYIQPHVNIRMPDQRRSDITTTYELSGIAPGQYELEMSGLNGVESRETAVNLSSDGTVDVNAATPLAEVTGKLVAAGGGKLPGSLYVLLNPQGGENRFSSRLEQDGSFRVRAVRPGTYEFVVGSDGYPLTVTQIAASGAAVAGRLIQIGGDPVHMTAAVAESTGVLHGFARSQGKSAPGVFLLLVPESANAGREAWRTNQSDSDGSFDFPQVMPGKYTLLAIEEGWTLDWARPEAIAKYMAGGLKIAVPAHAGDIALKDAVEVQRK